MGRVGRRWSRRGEARRRVGGETTRVLRRGGEGGTTCLDLPLCLRGSSSSESSTVSGLRALRGEVGDGEVPRETYGEWERDGDLGGMWSLGAAEGVVARVEDNLSRRGVVDVRGLERRCASEGVVMDRGPVGGLKGLGDSSGRKNIVRSRKICWDAGRKWLTRLDREFFILGE
jgi:hypothetical protein